MESVLANASIRRTYSMICMALNSYEIMIYYEIIEIKRSLN